MTFTETFNDLLDGKRITRTEWDDKRHYGLLQDYLLQIHKAGEKEELVHPWILSEGDLIAEDWYVL